MGVQNVQNGGSPLSGSGKREKLKVEAVKQNNNMLNGSLNPRSGCPKCKGCDW